MKEIQTASLVREEIEKDIFLKNSLFKGLINNSALARLLLLTIKKRNPKATLESVTISIVRYAQDLNTNSLETSLTSHIAHSHLSMKNDIVHATFPRNASIFGVVSDISKKIRWDLDEVLFVNQGSGEITIIVDKKNFPLIEGISSEAIEIRKDTATVSISESKIKGVEEGIEIPGLYSYFINQVSQEGITLLDIVSTRSQLTLVIKEKDLTRAYDILSNCIRHYREKPGE
ncbi:MAG: hypothetical protein UY63_C0022G0011 [Parcubacteria group bacterium GW2011_GWA2_51_10]|nr:MAG: hypothetical protein UY63_C0022G0011 [Parcubacteria group bacterium GW2011_GWA2_51_10]